MNETSQDPRLTLREIRRMPYGTARTAAAEAVTRRIETDGPREILAEALLDLIEAYTFNGDGPQSFVAFARTLRLWDESPELFDESDERNLFWEFKWVAGDLSDFPEVGREPAEAFLADMRRRFDLAGKGPSSVAMSEFRWAWHAGMPDMEAARINWLTTPRDEFDDCLSCTIGQQVDYFTENARFSEAVDLGRNQTTRCNLEPTRTLHALSLALLEVGEAAESADTYRRALATLDTSDSDFAPARGQAFELLARGGHLDRALRDLRDEYPALLEKASSPLFRLRFLLGVLAGLSANRSRFDDEVGIRGLAVSTVGELHTWVESEARALAERFDHRGSTDYYARLIARALAAQPTGHALPLDVHREAAPVTPRPAHTAEAADSALARAERARAAGDLVAAALAYAEAAGDAEEAGLLADGGLAWAESARAAQEFGDDRTAHERYALAVPRLRAGGADDAVMTQVLVTWAPTASRLDDSQAVLVHIDELLAAEQAPTPLRAALLDTLARIVASEPGIHDDRDAAAAASAAGELFAQSGDVAGAAHAFWVAGLVQAAAGDDESAVWSLESAVEGFTLVRDRGSRADAAGGLIDALRRLGRDARADQVVASLT